MCGQQNSLFAKRRQRLSYSSPTHRRFFGLVCVWMRGSNRPPSKGVFSTAEACCPHKRGRRREALGCIQQIFFPALFSPFFSHFCGFSRKAEVEKTGFPPSPPPLLKAAKRGFFDGETEREKPLGFLPMYPPPPRRRDFIGRFSAKKGFLLFFPLAKLHGGSFFARKRNFELFSFPFRLFFC